jgi:hypothetical protein
LGGRAACTRVTYLSSSFARSFTGVLTDLHMASVWGITASTEWITICTLCTHVGTATTFQLRRGKKHCPCLKETYSSWRNMIQRCTNPKHGQYMDYGGRGITVCEEWLASFNEFYRDMGKRPEGKTLDRPDNDGPYSPANCQWSTKEVQALNKRGSRKKPPASERGDTMQSCNLPR